MTLQEAIAECRVSLHTTGDESQPFSCQRDEDVYIALDTVLSELRRLRKNERTIVDAIRRYANHVPLDLKSPRQIQRELLGIAGDEHVYVNRAVGDACLICGRDSLDDAHIKLDEREPEDIEDMGWKR